MRRAYKRTMAEGVMNNLAMYPPKKYLVCYNIRFYWYFNKNIFNLNEITYLGFTSILLNIFKIRKKIKHTVNEIIKFNPDILFSVDSPDFTMRVAERVKKINNNKMMWKMSRCHSHFIYYLDQI